MYQVAQNDPRQDGFDWDRVRIDLRRCSFLRPAAVLWCTIYPLLVADKGVPCELLPPFQGNVASYLNDLGLFDILRNAGISVNYEVQRHHDRWQSILPITKMSTVSEVEGIEDSLIENLAQRNLTSGDIYTDVGVAFAELGNNAAEHAHSPIDAYGFVQFYNWHQNPRFVCAVADGGIGIRASLQKNPDYAGLALTDASAIDYAIIENVSGTQDNLRGLGLPHIVNDILSTGREININSGVGFFHADGGDGKPRSNISNLFPGTSAFINIPT